LDDLVLALPELMPKLQIHSVIAANDNSKGSTKTFYPTLQIVGLPPPTMTQLHLLLKLRSYPARFGQLMAHICISGAPDPLQRFGFCLWRFLV